jgi:hypothetical protein
VNNLQQREDDLSMKDDDVTVSNIMNAQAQFDHVAEVRSIAPAVVLVLEKDAPLRMETLASTEAERLALREECRSNPVWGEILDTWFANEHASRLQNGERISTPRVAEGESRPGRFTRRSDRGFGRAPGIEDFGS